MTPVAAPTAVPPPCSSSSFTSFGSFDSFASTPACATCGTGVQAGEGGVAGGESAAEDAFWDQFRATPQGRPAHRPSTSSRQSRSRHLSGTASRSGGVAGAAEITSRRIDYCTEGIGDEEGVGGCSAHQGGRGHGSGGGRGSGGGVNGMANRFHQKMSSMPPTPVRRMPIQPLNACLEPFCSSASAVAPQRTSSSSAVAGGFATHAQASSAPQPSRPCASSSASAPPAASAGRPLPAAAPWPSDYRSNDACLNSMPPEQQQQRRRRWQQQQWQQLHEWQTPAPTGPCSQPEHARSQPPQLSQDAGLAFDEGRSQHQMQQMTMQLERNSAGRVLETSSAASAVPPMHPSQRTRHAASSSSMSASRFAHHSMVPLVSPASSLHLQAGRDCTAGLHSHCPTQIPPSERASYFAPSSRPTESFHPLGMQHQTHDERLNESVLGPRQALDELPRHIPGPHTQLTAQAHPAMILWPQSHAQSASHAPPSLCCTAPCAESSHRSGQIQARNVPTTLGLDEFRYMGDCMDMNISMKAVDGAGGTGSSNSTFGSLNSQATNWFNSLVVSDGVGKAKRACGPRQAAVDDVTAPQRSMCNLYGASSGAQEVTRSSTRPGAVKVGVSSAQTRSRFF